MMKYKYIGKEALINVDGINLLKLKPGDIINSEIELINNFELINDENLENISSDAALLNYQALEEKKKKIKEKIDDCDCKKTKKKKQNKKIKEGGAQ